MALNVLHSLRLKELAKQWILEDTPSFDYAGAVVGGKTCKFEILFKSSGAMLAGLPFANAIFNEFALKVDWFYNEGDIIPEPCAVASVKGAANNILLAERVVLNVLCRACGVATTAYKFLEKLKPFGAEVKLAGTRKTTPGFRMVEKYALLIAGVDPHRYDLSSMVMLKSNHISIRGSIPKAVEEVRQLCGFTQKIEVECRSREEAMSALKSGCDIIMLDNFSPKNAIDTAAELKSKFPNTLIEVSGGIALDNITLYAEPEIDIISTSQLVQGYNTVDISMRYIN